MTERVVETKTARGPKKKRTVVTVNQAGNPAFLDAGRRALDRIAKIARRVAPRGGKEGAKGRGGETEKGRIREEAAIKEDSPKIGKVDLRASALRAWLKSNAAKSPRQTRRASPPYSRATKGDKIYRKKGACRKGGRCIRRTR